MTLAALGLDPHDPYEDATGAVINELTRGDQRVCIANQTDGVLQVLVSNDGKFANIVQRPQSDNIS